MALRLKNPPSEFQNIMSEMFFNPYSKFTIVYIDDVLVYSESIGQNFKYRNLFFNIIILKKKMD